MNIQTQNLQNILEALATISTRGNDTITMGNVLQALQQVIREISSMQMKQEEIKEETPTEE